MNKLIGWSVMASAVLLAACGGGSEGGGDGGSGGAGNTTYTVGGSISGLTAAGLVLQVNGGNDLTVASGATTFTSSNALTSGTAYAVTILTQPATQQCSVTNGSGTVASANVTNVAVACVNTYTVGVTIEDYVGTGLVLQLNGGNDLTPVAGTTAMQFFAPRLPNNAAYAVTILSQPTSPAQQCTVGNGSGVIANANVNNVFVSCIPLVFISGNVSGLTGTLGLQAVLSGFNAPSNQSITVQPGATTFSFPVGMIDEILFRVIVASQPAGQTCLVSRGAGLTGSVNITGIQVTCAGNLTSPLVGTYMLDNEPDATFTFNADGTYAMFYRTEDDGCINNDQQPLNGVEYGTYNWNSATGLFRILNAPVDQSGECGLNDPTEVDIYGATLTKSADTLSLVSNDPNDPWSGTVTAVPSTTGALLGSYRTQNGGALTFLGDGTFLVTTTQGRPDGSQNNGTFAGIEHGCYTTTATVLNLTMASGCLPGGRNPVDTSGTAGLLANGQPRSFGYVVNGDTLVLTAGTNSVSYPRIVLNGIEPPPAPPAGTYLVSGTLTGLTSDGLVLQLNGGNELYVASGSSSFSFANVPLATGVPYAVTVRTQPSGPTLRCTVTNGSGTMGSANVTNVAVDCIVPTTFTVGGTVTGLTGELQIGLFTGPTATETLTLQSGATSFAYAAQLATGTGFGTIVTAQPTGQTCVVTHSSGVIATSDVNGTRITCVANTTAPLAGTYSGMFDDTFIAVQFFADGRYLLALRETDATNCRNANGQLTSNGIEYGVYNWNATSGAFNAVAAMVDTTGECGLVSDSGGAPFQGTLTRSGNTATIAFTDDDGNPATIALTAGPNVTGQLPGTYTLQNGRMLMLFGDGTYLSIQAQAAIAGAAANTSTVGLEHGCYTSNATHITYNHTNTCALPGGKPPIDMNAFFFLKLNANLTGAIPYTINGDVLTLYNGAVVVTRVIGN